MIRPGTVLLVEDDANDTALLQRALHRAELDLDVQVVEDGDKAIAYLSGRGDYEDRERFPMPRLVLLDLKLPRRSGMEVLEWIRRQPGLQRLPVIVMTSSRQAANIKKAYDLGANSYLVKPVGFEKLLELVQTLETFWREMSTEPETERS